MSVDALIRGWRDVADRNLFVYPEDTAVSRVVVV